MFNFKDIFLKSADILIKANFAIATILLAVVAFLAVTNNEILFEDSEEFADLYGPLASNLRIILVYVGIAGATVATYCWYNQKQHFLFGVGFFYLFLIAGFAIYGDINQIPIDPQYNSFFLYQGVSHIVFGGFYLIAKFYRVKQTGE